MTNGSEDNNTENAALALLPTFHAVAVNATEMQAANERTGTWLDAKLRALESEAVEAQTMLDSAIRNKWASSSFRSHLQRVKSKLLYYGKLRAALSAGYTIVPNMEMDVFAIRVRRELPAQRPLTESAQTYSPHPRLPDEVEQRLSIGEGRYESPLQRIRTTRAEEKDAAGKITKHITCVEPIEFDALDFPLAIAHPVVMDATAAAMARLIFDRIGVVPSRVSHGDPIVLGQITRKEGWATKTASFLIAWYLDVKTL